MLGCGSTLSRQLKKIEAASQTLKTSRPVGMNEIISCPSPSDSLPQEPKWECLARPLRMMRIEDEKKRRQVKSKDKSA